MGCSRSLSLIGLVRTKAFARNRPRWLRFARDYAAARVERDLAACIEELAQVRSSSLHAGLHCWERNAQHLGGLSLVKAFELRKR